MVRSCDVVNYFPGTRGPVVKEELGGYLLKDEWDVPETLGTSTPAGYSFPVPSVTLLFSGEADLGAPPHGQSGAPRAPTPYLRLRPSGSFFDPTWRRSSPAALRTLPLPPCRTLGSSNVSLH